MRLPERYWTASFDAITDGKHKRVVGRYVQKIHEVMSRGFGLLFWGANGTGKTSAAVVCMKQARRHSFTCLFIRAADLLKSDVNKTFFDSSRVQTVYERARTVDLLVIDDLGKEGHPGSGYMAGYATDLFEDLVRDRSSRLRATIFTTNMSPADIQKGGEDGLYKKSMGHVLKASTLAVKVEGNDLRKAEAEELESSFGDAFDKALK
jgi:DNA replication protein DnaC